jgi:hypothetical protein
MVKYTIKSSFVLIVFLCLFSFSNCTKVIYFLYPSLRGDSLTTKDTEDRLDLPSKYSSKNTIYKTNREFIYVLTTNVAQSDSLLLKLKVIPGDFFGQTKIKYKYYKNDSLIWWELTGLEETKKLFWMHPPRSLFPDMETAPFFEFRRNYPKNKKWHSTISTSSDWGEYKNTIFYSQYVYTGDTIYNCNNKLVSCKIINSSTTSKIGNSKNVFLFNDSIGLVDALIITTKQNKYHFALIGVITNK